ncbi:MAG: GTP-binding protein [Methanomicrobia archaeon]|nr:GTP-binding protein [Methanomicrobia archaeon]HDM22718.1 GTP-binding protein [Methanomicrobia archaeon]
MMCIEKILSEGEKHNIEFKSYLNDDHLSKERKQRLVSQMKYRLERGNGKAYYIIGVYDDGKICGLTENKFLETLDVIREVSKEVGAEIKKIEKFNKNGVFARITIENNHEINNKTHIVIGTIGHVDHGKSTLIGTLITGQKDDGSGKTRIFLDFLPHEIERGLTAEIAYAVYGFDDEGNPMKLKNPLNKKEVAGVVDKAKKLISFVDCPGHAPWLRTTIRGILGQKVDYALLVIDASEGVTSITKEHMGIAIAMEMPMIIVLTKMDRVSEEEAKAVEENISILLKKLGRIPYKVKNHDINIENEKIVPILKCSAITKEGFDLLDRVLFKLPDRTKKPEKLEKPFLMYIDKVYSIKGVGTVVTGRVMQGVIENNRDLYLGPFEDGYRKIRGQTIMEHYHYLNRAEAGDVVGIALKNVKKEEIKRGMILSEKEGKKVREFIGDVFILSHPTTIKEGYEPVLHLETISESVRFEEIYGKEYLSVGDRAKVRMRFKYNAYHIEEGEKFIFREGRSKGIGGVEKVL